jgi:hypothetical protein
MRKEDAVMTFFLVLAAFGAGFWLCEREHAGKFPFEPKPPKKRWRV